MTTGIIAGTLALQKGTEKEIETETEVAIGEIAIGIATVIRTEVEEIETVIGIETGVPTVTGEPCADIFLLHFVDSPSFLLGIAGRSVYLPLLCLSSLGFEFVHLFLGLLLSYFCYGTHLFTLCHGEQ